MTNWPCLCQPAIIGTMVVAMFMLSSSLMLLSSFSRRMLWQRVSRIWKNNLIIMCVILTGYVKSTWQIYLIVLIRLLRNTSISFDMCAIWFRWRQQAYQVFEGIPQLSSCHRSIPIEEDQPLVSKWIPNVDESKMIFFSRLALFLLDIT